MVLKKTLCITKYHLFLVNCMSFSSIFDVEQISKKFIVPAVVVQIIHGSEVLHFYRVSSLTAYKYLRRIIFCFLYLIALKCTTLAISKIFTGFTWFVRKVMSVSQIKKIYWTDRYNTFKGFKIGSSCVNTSLPARFPGIEDVTVHGRPSPECPLEPWCKPLWLCQLSRNDVLSWAFSGAETKRNLGDPRQDCWATGESLAPLNRPGSESRGRRSCLFQRAMHYGLHGRRKWVSRETMMSIWFVNHETPVVVC